MGWQPSASKTDIFLRCPRPFDPEITPLPDDPGEPALYGSAFHQVMAACLRSTSKRPLERSGGPFAKAIDKAVKRFDIKDAAQELALHLKGSVKVLRKWLAKEKLKIVEVERAYAIRPRLDGCWTVRSVAPHDEEHRYAVGTDEMPGTVDLIAKSANGKRTVVLDHKTGLFEDWFGGDENVRFALPTSVPQLRTLGLIAPVTRANHESEVAIFHADRKGLPIVYSEPYEYRDQVGHAEELAKAFRRIGDGFLRPGEYCRRCPARVGCPARAAALLVESSTVLVEAANKIAVEPVDPKTLFALPTEELEPGLVEARAGALYDMLKRFRELEKVASEELRRLVRAGAVIETRDGRVLAIRQQTFETLSKKAVLQALGKIAGERELERLRKKGIIRESTREMLIAED